MYAQAGSTMGTLSNATNGKLSRCRMASHPSGRPPVSTYR